MRVAAAQIYIKDDIVYNFEKTLDYIEKARKEKVELIVFPECNLTGYLGISLDSLDTINITQLDDTITEIKKVSAQKKIAVVIGQYLKRCGKWYNNVIFIGKDGKLKSSYDKNHLIDTDCYHICPGEPPIVFEVDNIRFSLGICHDIRYPEPLRWAAMNGSQIHIHPFYGFRKENEIKVQEVYNAMLSSRAVENGVYIIAPNAANYEQMVRSQIRNPQGYLESISETWKEDLIVCDMDPQLAGNGWVTRRRADIYQFSITSNRQSFFEKGYWEKQGYMIKHDQSLLNYP